MLPHENFLNMKVIQVSIPISNELCLPYFFPFISYTFTSKYANVRVAYAGTILVPIAIPTV